MFNIFSLHITGSCFVYVKHILLTYYWQLKTLQETPIRYVLLGICQLWHSNLLYYYTSNFRLKIIYSTCSKGLYHKTLQICNFQKMGLLHSKIVCSIVCHKHTSWMNTVAWYRQIITNPWWFYIKPMGLLLGNVLAGAQHLDSYYARNLRL